MSLRPRFYTVLLYCKLRGDEIMAFWPLLLCGGRGQINSRSSKMLLKRGDVDRTASRGPNADQQGE